MGYCVMYKNFAICRFHIHDVFKGVSLDSQISILAFADSFVFGDVLSIGETLVTNTHRATYQRTES